MAGNMFDKAKDKAQELMGQHGDKVDQGVDRAAEFADEKTGGKHGDKIHRGADELKERIQQPPA